MKDDVRSLTAGPLTISQFAARSGLSVKALRLYDLSGLLPPRRTDLRGQLPSDRGESPADPSRCTCREVVAW